MPMGDVVETLLLMLVIDVPIGYVAWAYILVPCWPLHFEAKATLCWLAYGLAAYFLIIRIIALSTAIGGAGEQIANTLWRATQAFIFLLFFAGLGFWIELFYTDMQKAKGAMKIFPGLLFGLGCFAAMAILVTFIPYVVRTLRLR